MYPTSNHVHSIPCRWVPPNAGFLKINCYGAYKKGGLFGFAGSLAEVLGSKERVYVGSHRACGCDPWVRVSKEQRAGIFLLLKQTQRGLLAG